MTGGERRARMALALSAAGNIVIALWIIVTQPARAADLHTMYYWCGEWLVRHADLYTVFNASTDYPPNAIVLFAPMAWLPARWLVPSWTMLGLALAALLPLTVARAADDRRVHASLVIVSCLCWAATRTLLQFSALSMTLSFAALALSAERPWSAGLLLGLALAKPHIAAPVALWVVLTGRWRTAAAAAAVMSAGVTIYCLRAGTTPGNVTAAYWQVLASTYGGASGLTGVTSIRAWTGSDAVWLAAAGAMLLVPVAMTVLAPRARGLDRLTAIAAFCLWSLAAFYHNGNNLILMLPAFIVLLQRAHAAAVLMQVLLMIDLPARFPHTPFAHVNRALVLVTLGGLVVFWWRARGRVDIIAR